MQVKPWSYVHRREVSFCAVLLLHQSLGGPINGLYSRRRPVFGILQYIFFHELIASLHADSITQGNNRVYQILMNKETRALAKLV